MILPCLSLTQPWCELVLGEADKDIENRVWNCHKRGVFLIHAASGMSDRQFEQAVSFAANATGKAISHGGVRYVPDHELDRPIVDAVYDRSSIKLGPFRRGGIVGAAVLLDVVPRDEPERSRHPKASSPWLMDGQFGFVLGARVRLPFRPYSGRQRWFNVETTDAETDALVAAGLIERGSIRIQSLEVEYEGSAEGARSVLGALGDALKGRQ